jgi:hypothetical protein
MGAHARLVCGARQLCVTHAHTHARIHAHAHTHTHPHTHPPTPTHTPDADEVFGAVTGDGSAKPGTHGADGSSNGSMQRWRGPQRNVLMAVQASSPQHARQAPRGALILSVHTMLGTHARNQERIAPAHSRCAHASTPLPGPGVAAAAKCARTTRHEEEAQLRGLFARHLPASAGTGIRPHRRDSNPERGQSPRRTQALGDLRRQVLVQKKTATCNRSTHQHSRRVPAPQATAWAPGSSVLGLTRGEARHKTHTVFERRC